MSDLVLESVHPSGGIKNGALVRRVHPTSLSTLICFTTPHGLYHVHNRIEFDDADPRHWTHYLHHDRDRFVEREHEASDPGDVVPSFAEYLLVGELLDSGEQELAFTMLIESGGSLRPAVLRHEGDEVGLYLDGELVNRHRVVGEDIIASDWGGLGSRRVDDVGELMEGLDEQVAIRVRMFLDE
ncbi:hypothetical protein [Luteococcus peritonei]|uniref:Uncharacterized protein n=1 Tax=Luteococcus peritonei TaxID=88874 RepID=A0ABW4RXS8_9ACTN